MSSHADRQRHVRQRSTPGGVVALARRSVRGWFGLVVLAGGGVASFAQLPPEARAPRILVGPNVLVSREPSVAHVEPWVAAHPTDPSKLIAMATTFRDFGGRFIAALYASSDGGAARAIAKVHSPGDDEVGRRRAAGRFDVAASVDAAVDTRSTRYRDRMYLVHAEKRVGTAGDRLVLTYSADRGITWSAPKDVAPETDPEASQFHSAIAVNRDGTVGVFWYDTRELVGRDQWHVYFTASLDGGDTFLPPVRVSSEPSTPFTAENHRPLLASVQQSPKGVSLSMRSAFARFPNGGDYVGLTADAAGVFHPFWTDSRTGSFQLFTSRIQVVRESGPRETIARQGAAPARAEVVNDKVTLALDPARLDWAAGEMLLPVRLRNTSNDTLYGPFTVEIVRLVAPWWSSGGGGRDRSAVAELLNSSNGLIGKGARIDYAPALRDLPALLPGAVSEAITWRVRPPSLRRTEGLDIEVVITGYVAAKPGKGSVP